MPYDTLSFWLPSECSLSHVSFMRSLSNRVHFLSHGCDQAASGLSGLTRLALMSNSVSHRVTIQPFHLRNGTKRVVTTRPLPLSTSEQALDSLISTWLAFVDTPHPRQHNHSSSPLHQFVGCMKCQIVVCVRPLRPTLFEPVGRLDHIHQNDTAWLPPTN